MKKIIFTSALICVFNISFAQFNLRDSTVNGFLFITHYSYNFPGGDMVKRFGSNSAVGGNILYKFNKNWVLGLDGSFLFGNNVKEDSLFKQLQNTNGDIIGEDGFPVSINLFERGFFLGAKIGKSFRILGSNANSGLLISVSGGLLQHKIRIEVKEGNVPQLNKEYKKGYDRLSNGFAISEYIGFMHLDKRKLLNFHIGLEFFQGFTQSRRDWNFDANLQDNTSRLDLLYGIKIGWILPVYIKHKGDLTYTY